MMKWYWSNPGLISIAAAEPIFIWVWSCFSLNLHELYVLYLSFCAGWIYHDFECSSIFLIASPCTTSSCLLQGTCEVQLYAAVVVGAVVFSPPVSSCIPPALYYIYYITHQPGRFKKKKATLLTFSLQRSILQRQNICYITHQPGGFEKKKETAEFISPKKHPSASKN